MEVGEYYLHNYEEVEWDSKHTGDIWLCIARSDSTSKHPKLKVVSPIASANTKPYINHPAHLEEDYLEKI